MESPSYIDLKAPFRRNFEEYFLKRNPFPAIGVPIDTPVITADREKIIENFRRMISSLVENEDSLLTVMVGEYGSGKSHLLKLFKFNVNNQLLSRDNGILAVYIKSPGEIFKEFTLSFIDDIGRTLLQNISEEMIKDFLKETRNIKRYIHNETVINKIYNDTATIQEIFLNTPVINIIRDVIISKFQIVRNKDVCRAVLSLSYHLKASLSWRWLLGENLSRTDKDSLEVNSSIDNNNAYDTLLDFIKTLNCIGIKKIVLLADELEKIVQLTKTKRDQYQNDLRQFIDDNPTNMMFYFSMSPRQWKELTQETSALVRRLSGNWYLLDEFEEEDILELIEKYLSTVRTENYSGKVAKKTYPNLKPSLSPFSEESIVTIKEITEGVASQILLLCRKSLNYLHDNRNNFDHISSDLVKEAYTFRGG